MRPPKRRRKQKDMLLQLIPVLACILIALIIIACILPRPQTGDPSMESTAGTTGSTNTSSNTNSSSTLPSDEPTSSGSTDTTGSTGPTDTTGSTGPTDTSGTTGPTEPSNTTGPNNTTAPNLAPDSDLEAFFSETVFIGDSITYGLSTYCNIYNPLYGAKFLCASSFAVRHAIVDPDPGNKNIVSIKYQGVSMRPEDALAQMGAKRVFIMLGLNDLSFGVDYTIGNWKVFIENIRKTCPDIEIFIQSATPLHAKKDIAGNKLNNANMNAYNEKLEALCEEMDCHFVDVSTALKDQNGQLKNEYCSDEYCHMSYAGIEVWITTLKSYVSNLIT